jgi:hypothetical protein
VSRLPCDALDYINFGYPQKIFAPSPSVPKTKKCVAEATHSKMYSSIATTQIESVNFARKKGEAYEDGAYIFMKDKNVHFALCYSDP